MSARARPQEKELYFCDLGKFAILVSDNNHEIMAKNLDKSMQKIEVMMCRSREAKLDKEVISLLNNTLKRDLPYDKLTELGELCKRSFEQRKSLSLETMESVMTSIAILEKQKRAINLIISNASTGIIENTSESDTNTGDYNLDDLFKILDDI